MSDIQSIDTIAFRQTMRNLASGVAIVATRAAAGQRGLTVSSVSSICMETPCLLVGMKANSEVHETILANGFSVGLLGSDLEDLALRFAGRHGAKGVHRLDTAPWESGLLDVIARLSLLPDPSLGTNCS